MSVHDGTERGVSQHEQHHVGIGESLGASDDGHDQLFDEFLLRVAAANQLQLLRCADLRVRRRVDGAVGQCGEEEAKAVFATGHAGVASPREQCGLRDEDETEKGKETLEGNRGREKGEELGAMCGGEMR